MQNPLVVMQILLVPFIIRISTKLGKKSRERSEKRSRKEDNGEKSLGRFQSPPHLEM
jgi:hypothetical protein